MMTVKQRIIYSNKNSRREIQDDASLPSIIKEVQRNLPWFEKSCTEDSHGNVVIFMFLSIIFISYK